MGGAVGDADVLAGLGVLVEHGEFPAFTIGQGLPDDADPSEPLALCDRLGDQPHPLLLAGAVLDWEHLAGLDEVPVRGVGARVVLRKRLKPPRRAGEGPQKSALELMAAQPLGGEDQHRPRQPHGRFAIGPRKGDGVDHVAADDHRLAVLEHAWAGIS